MWPVSSGFTSALRSPSMKAAIQVTTSDGTVLGIASGSVEMDSRRAIQRTATLELTPTSSLSLQQVYALVMSPGIELTIKRGLVINGSAEYVPLGVFVTDSASVQADNAATVSWAGSDRSKRIAQNMLIDAYPIAAGGALSSALAALLIDRWPQVTYDFTNVPDTVLAPLALDGGGATDPWQAAVDLAEKYGYLLAFKGDGIARANPVLDPATSAAGFDFGAGATNLVLGGQTDGSFDETYNGVVATAEGSNVDPPVQAVIWDTDPASPTYYLGGFGQRPYFISSPDWTTADACTTAATTQLARMKGRQESFSWPAVVNPALEPLDIVTVTIAGVTSRLVLDKLTIPLSAAEPMSAVARQVSVA